MVEFSTLNAKAMDVIKNIVKKQPLSVIAISREGKNWEALVEVLERKAIPDTQNLIGIYKILLSDVGKVLGYERKEVRRKCDVGEETPSKEERE